VQSTGSPVHYEVIVRDGVRNPTSSDQRVSSRPPRLSASSSSLTGWMEAGELGTPLSKCKGRRSAARIKRISLFVTPRCTSFGSLGGSVCLRAT